MRRIKLNAPLLLKKRKATPPITPDQKLLSRRQTSMVLGGLSISSLRRMEIAGLLTPRRPGGKPTSPVYYRMTEVRQLAGE